MALMLQLEVAERVAASPGGKTYGSLSILTQVYCDARIVRRVSPGAFRPPPKVESAVVYLRPLPTPRIDPAEQDRFHTVVRAAFAQRRKTLANALAAGLGLSVDRAREAARSVGIDPSRRAETLDIKEFAALARRL
jgi:16S rRNA (adenine1518-N6/adenine1519-N6)-dimethyltransferase